MKPPDHNPTNRPQQVHGEASGQRPVIESVGAPKPVVGEFGIEKPKPEKFGDRIFEIYFAKTIAEARKLGNLNLPQAALERAARTLAETKAKMRLKAAIKYAINSAKSETISEAEILTEVLPEIGITTMKLCPKEPKKQGSRARKEKEEDHGA